MMYNNYLIYKKKYLILRNQIGSSVLEIIDTIEDDKNTENIINNVNSYVSNNELNNFYLPCEITHYTTHIFSDERNNQNIQKVILPDYLQFIDFLEFIEFKSGTTYKQDIYIQLYNNSRYYNIYNSRTIYIDDIIQIKQKCIDNVCYCINKKDERINTQYNFDDIFLCNPSEKIHGNIKNITVISTNLPIILRDDFIKYIDIPNEYQGEQSKGGNFISGPKKIHNNSKYGFPIFYISGIYEEHEKLLNLINCPLIKLECSFKSLGDTNIGSYLIHSLIELNENLNKNKYYNDEFSYDDSECECECEYECNCESKYNYDELDCVDFNCDKFYENLFNLDEFNNSLIFNSDGFRHIDELMCFMPYGINNYKIWFYDILTINSLFKYKYINSHLNKNLVILDHINKNIKTTYKKNNRRIY